MTLFRLSAPARRFHRVGPRLMSREIRTTAPAMAPEESAPATPEGGGFLGTGLSPLYAVPAGIFAGIPIIHNQVLVLNEETQLVGCFAAFVITAYTQGGAAVAKMLDDKAQAIIEEHSAS